MPSTLPSAHFSSVLADYSVSAGALAVSNVPTAAQVQRRTHASADAITNPHVMFEVEVDPDSSQSLLTLDFTMRLVADVGTETGQTTRTQAQTWLQALATLFDDDRRSVWQAFIEAQTDAYRQGWDIQAIWPRPLTIEYNEDMTLLTLTAPFQVSSYWNNA